jgi:HAMP domain-containing protein
MTWYQVAVLGFLLFSVGWAIEARLERILNELARVRQETEDMNRQIRDSTTELVMALETEELDDID